MQTEAVTGTGTTTLDLDEAIAAARDLTGLTDFGDLDGFQERAGEWLSAAEREARLEAPARAALQQLVTGWLATRLRFADDLRRHPEIKEEVVRAPIFITGIPRTGTTKLQRVLSCDPANQSLPFWRILNVAPLPGGESAEPDPRIAVAAGYLGMLEDLKPEFLVGHPMGAEEPEEEGFLAEIDFQALCNCFRVPIPEHYKAIVDRPDFESYPFLKLGLQYVQWQRGPAGQRPWVLKTVSHIGHLENLFATFPDATVVHCYRDPRVAMGSVCRLIELFRTMLVPDLDLHRHGAELLSLWSDMQERHLAARRDPAIDSRMVDVYFDDICADVVQVADRVYKGAGRTLDETARNRMRAWDAEHPRHQRGRFEYSLERYGLTADQVGSAFAPYIERFGR